MTSGSGLAVALTTFGLWIAACSDPHTDPLPSYEPQTFQFGPLAIPPTSEDTSKCVAITLNNPAPLFVNQVKLDTGPGFHHSNWLWVPDHSFPGPDGVFDCDERQYDQTAAGILGGVFFAQSTQSEQEIQQFPEGVALMVPETSKLVAQIHLLNAGDEALALEPSIGFTPLPPEEVTTRLSSVTFEYHPLGLPPQKQSRFTVECEIGDRHQELFGRAPDFKIFYALAHYHEWGTGLTIEAVRPDGTASTIYTTTANVGDTLGGMLDPAFDMTGFTKLRLSCEYFNDKASTIYYGNGGGEMCIFNAFSSSDFKWAGGALDTGDPGTPTDVDGVMSFTRGCQVYAVEGEH